MSHEGHARRPELTVLAAGAGKHVFHRLGGRPIRVVGPDAEQAAEPDVIVVPCDQRPSKMQPFELPNRIWRRVAEGQSVVVFDSAAEGHLHLPGESDALHRFLAEHSLPPSFCVYLTQDRGYGADYASYCAEAGAGEPMRVLNYDFWIARTIGENRERGAELYQMRRQAFEQRAARREKRFISLNLSPRRHRIMFLLRLIRDGLFDRGFISAGLGFTDDGPHVEAKLRKKLRSYPGFADLHDELIPFLDELAAKGPLLLGDVDVPADGGRVREVPWRDTLREEHDRSWFSIVTETAMPGRLWRITEKPLKPLMNFHPLIVLGAPGSLQLIRQLGFRTFGGYFDEAYDEETSPRRRFDMVYAEAVRLCALDEAELLRLEQAVAETLDFNAHWGLVELPRKYREEFDRDLLDAILAPLEHPR
jgi:hypothetical protein